MSTGGCLGYTTHRLCFLALPPTGKGLRRKNRSNEGRLEQEGGCQRDAAEMWPGASLQCRGGAEENCDFLRFILMLLVFR